MGKYELNKNLAQMLKGGVIMDVTNAEQAKSPRRRGLVLLWHWSGCRQISAATEGWRVCLIRA